MPPERRPDPLVRLLRAAAAAASDLPLVAQALRTAGYLRDTGGTSDAASSR
jgi:hypothetical protein